MGIEQGALLAIIIITIFKLIELILIIWEKLRVKNIKLHSNAVGTNLLDLIKSAIANYDLNLRIIHDNELGLEVDNDQTPKELLLHVNSSNLYKFDPTHNLLIARLILPIIDSSYSFAKAILTFTSLINLVLSLSMIGILFDLIKIDFFGKQDLIYAPLIYICLSFLNFLALYSKNQIEMKFLLKNSRKISSEMNIYQQMSQNNLLTIGYYQNMFLINSIKFLNPVSLLKKVD
jgi:hypothetical protein